MDEKTIQDIGVFQNPEYKALEDLKLTVKNNGVFQIIPALDKYWIEKKYFLNYEAPNLIDVNGKNIFGAKERWFELTDFIVDDLIWLLHLPFYQFWSNIIYNPSIMDSIITFLQEAPTFCSLENFVDDNDLKEHFNKIRQNVLIIFARLITNKESSIEYLSFLKHAHLIYNKYIFTVPILMDLCQQYGRDNKKTVEKIVNSVFTLQPLYKEDLRKAVIFITQVLRKIERRFENCPINQDGKAIPLSERGEANVEISLPCLEDIILYLLDIVSTVSVFLDIYIPSADNFKTENFLSKIIAIYGNTIPEMYKRLNDLAFKDEIIPKYMELKHRLDVTRVEILKIYRTITYKKIKDIVETKNLVSTYETGEIVEDFLFNLIHTLSEKEFIIDYHNIYPVTNDFQTLLDLQPDLDTVKCEFIINSIFTFLEEPIPTLTSTLNRNIPESITGTDCITNDHTLETSTANCILASSQITNKFEVELISEVKDIFFNLDEEIIRTYLKHYNYNKEAVINAVLEDTLPIKLKSLESTISYIPSHQKELIDAHYAALENKQMNIYDSDQFNLRTKNDIDTLKIQEFERKNKLKNINELLNEKSHIADCKDIYSKYSIITSEYDDEYDDTYDDQDNSSNVQDNIVEVESRSFTISRLQCKQDVCDFKEIKEENSFEFESEIQTNKKICIQDPVFIKTQTKEKRLIKQKGQIFDLDCKNDATEEHQKNEKKSKEIMDCRNKKNKHKASKVNHDRRFKSQWKRNRGIIPS